MPVSDIQLAITILEVVALLLPFVGIIYSAFVHDGQFIETESEGLWTYVSDPRYQLKAVVALLILTAAVALGPVWASLDVSNYLKIAVFLLVVSFVGILIMVESLVEARVAGVEEVDER